MIQLYAPLRLERSAVLPWIVPTIVCAVDFAQMLNRPVIRLVVGLLLLIGALFLVWGLARALGSALALGLELHLGWLAVALASALLYVSLGGVAWSVLLRALLRSDGLSAPPLHQSVVLFVVGNLGRYAPGTIWFLATRAYLAGRIGLPAAPVAASLAIELALIVLAGALVTAIGLLVLPPLAVLRPLAIPVGILPLLVVANPGLFRATQRLVSRSQPESPRVVAVRSRLRLLLIYTGVWVVGAVTLWLVIRSVGPVEIDAFPAVLGAWGVGFLAGFAVPFLPSGIGVREGVLTVLLASVVGLDTAVASAVLFRVVLTAAEVGCLALCAPFMGAIIGRR